MKTEENLTKKLEALLFIAEAPLPLVTLASSLGVPVGEVSGALEALGASLNDRAVELREVGGGWRLYLKPEFDEIVSDYVTSTTPSKLSQAALETLAVIAYKQPVTRASVAAIRAVNVDSVIRTLLGRGLIEEAFVDPETGASNFVTTPLMLELLGINSLDDLPAISPLLPDTEDVQNG